MLQEWEWSERYPEQPEILRYLEHVAKRHDLKRDMQFNTRVTAGEFDEATNLWTVHTDKGEPVTARYLITAVGTLSTTNMPQFKGLDTLQGQVVSHQPLPALPALTSPASAWPWSAPAPPRCRRSRKSPSRPSN